MRIKQSRLKTYYHKVRMAAKDNEGNTTDIYPNNPSAFQAEIWAASGKLQSEIYGQRLNYIQNCKVEGTYTIKTEKGRVLYEFDGFSMQESDGICVYIDKDMNPDYKIISIKPYQPLRLELEKI